MKISVDLNPQTKIEQRTINFEYFVRKDWIQQEYKFKLCKKWYNYAKSFENWFCFKINFEYNNF